jgi:hypothetical protein
MLNYLFISFWLSAAVLLLMRNEGLFVLVWLGLSILFAIAGLIRFLFWRGKPKRRFGLRELFLQVTAICVLFGCVAWRRHVAAERNHYLVELNLAGKIHGVHTSESSTQRWLGDYDLITVELRRGRYTKEEARKLQEYFPEAEIRFIAYP